MGDLILDQLQILIGRRDHVMSSPTATSIQGLLLRVGIDQTAGAWNAPCRLDGRFCYVPIPEDDPSGTWLDHRYDEFASFVQAIGGQWPGHLPQERVCHLDPDFS